MMTLGDEDCSHSDHYLDGERRNSGSISPPMEPSARIIPNSLSGGGVPGVGAGGMDSMGGRGDGMGEQAATPPLQRQRAASPCIVPPPPRRFDAEKVLRCDIAKGLMRSSGEAVELDYGLDAPPFVVPFEMLEPTTIPKLLLDAIWVLTNIKSCTEKGEGGAYITGLHGLHVTLDKNNAHKSVIRRLLADGSKMQLNEISLQIRVQEVSARLEPLRKEGQPDAEESASQGKRAEAAGVEVVRERFLLLVARSPLAFSLRKAAYTATRSVGRLTVHDSRGADERRRVWAQLAMHVRGPLQPYMTGADLMEMFEPSMDWMRSGEADGFSCLFSMQRAVDWMKARFIAKYEGRYRFDSHLTIHGLMGRMRLPGAGNDSEGGEDSDSEAEGEEDDANDASMRRTRRRVRRVVASAEEEEEEEDDGEDYLVTPRFVDACRQYDEDVDRCVASRERGLWCSFPFCFDGWMDVWQGGGAHVSERSRQAEAQKTQASSWQRTRRKGQPTRAGRGTRRGCARRTRAER
jgi:hypothetical protein